MGWWTLKIAKEIIKAVKFRLIVTSIYIWISHTHTHTHTHARTHARTRARAKVVCTGFDSVHCKKNAFLINLEKSLRNIFWGFQLEIIMTILVDFFKLSGQLINPFQPSVAINIETSQLICTANQMTGFYIKCNTGLKWVNQICCSYHTETSQLICSAKSVYWFLQQGNNIH